MRKAIAIASVLLLLPVVVLVLVVGTEGCAPFDDSPTGSGATKTVDPDDLPVDSVGPFGKEQLVNAAIIMNAAKDLGLPMRAQIIGVMTAIGESSLQVLDRGDAVGPDSRGLFQQRDNGAWGSYTDRMDPYISSTNFFKALAKITGWQSMTPTQAAHKVQRNADPNHYAKYYAQAVAIVEALGDVTITDTNDEPAHAGGSTETRYSLPNVKPHVAQVAEVVGGRFDIETIGGYRPGNSRDTEGHPAGLALDFMVSITPAGKAKGQQVADYLKEHHAVFNVTYIIWHQQIWTVQRAEDGWRDMEDRGSPTQNHHDHIHVSFTASADGDPAQAGGDTATPECTASPGGGGTPPPGHKKPGPWGGYENGHIPGDELAEIPWASGEYLRQDARDALTRLNEAYREEFGTNLAITDTYRNYAEQLELKRRKGKMAATPGKSNHGWALAVDLGGGINRFGTPQHEWMKQHGPDYGWVHPDWAHSEGSLPEPWHFEFWGVKE